MKNANTITIEIQKQLVKDFLLNNTSKAALAREYNISPRTAGRYIEKFIDEVKAELEAANTQDEQQPIETDVTEIQMETPEVEVAASEAETTEEAEEETDQVVTKVTMQRATRTPRAPVTRGVDGLTENQRNILNSYYKQKGSVQKFEQRVGVTGRAKKGVKTIRFITMEILENLANSGELSKMKREDVIQQIADTAKVDQKIAQQYYSGHKIFFMR